MGCGASTNDPPTKYRPAWGMRRCPSDIWTIVFEFLHPKWQSVLCAVCRIIRYQYSEAVKQRRIAAAGFMYDPAVAEEDREYFPLDLRSEALRRAPRSILLAVYINVAVLVVEPQLSPVEISTGTRGISIGDSFGAGWRAVSAITFDAAEDLTSVGSNWLYKSSIVSFDSTGLTALRAVGNGWLARSSLINFRSAGLSALTSVGDGWLSRASALRTFDSRGLIALTSVGSFWLDQAPSLTTFDSAGLTALTSVGSHWLFQAPALTTFDRAGLTALSSVGSYWLYEAPGR